MAQKNTLRYVILGLLSKEPMAGYDIKKRLREKSVIFGIPITVRFIRSLIGWNKKAL